MACTVPLIASLIPSWKRKWGKRNRRARSNPNSETLRAYNNLIGYRRLRIDAVSGSLSTVMWAVIWVGAVISISVAYLYKIEDARLHSILVALMAGFLGVVLFMIVINDRPFIGKNSIRPDSYRVILNHLIGSRR